MFAHFEWDPNKAFSNFLKHGVSFDEAKTVFTDKNALIENDVKHSKSEKRIWMIGKSSIGRVLVVLFTERTGSLRIISARKANDREKGKFNRG